MLSKLRRFIQPILDSPNADTRRPVIDANFESNIPGLYVIGDLGGAPVVKLAMAQGSQVADHIAAKPDARTAAASADPNRYDLLVVGAGAAGLNAALGAQAHGLRVAVIEKNKIANTIEDFPEGKWIYAEPESVPAAGQLRAPCGSLPPAACRELPPAESAGGRGMTVPSALQSCRPESAEGHSATR